MDRHAQLTSPSSATSTAARAADQPTSLSSPLALLSPTLPAPCPPAHISDTTSTNRLHEFLIEIHPIGQNHVGKGALGAVYFKPNV